LRKFYAARYGKRTTGHAEKRKREEKRIEGGERSRYGAGRKGRKDIGERERTRDTCTRKKSKSPSPWKPDGIAFVVCYRSSGFFGWE